MEPLNNKYISLITRVLTDEASPEDRLELDRWMTRDDKNAELFAQYQAVWAVKPEASPQVKSDKKRAWEAINQGIEAAKTPAVPLETNRPARRILFAVAGIAAVLLLSFGIFQLFFSHPPATMLEQFAETKMSSPLLLPDDSQVTLNAGSLLSYPTAFEANNRTVELHGEGFFDVAHDPEKPFVVNLGAISVKVLGTSFNVAQSADHKSMIVSVISGKVLVYSTLLQPRQQVILSQGDRAVFDQKTQTLFSEPISDYNFMAWKTGILQFDNTPLPEVFEALENTYQVNIKCERDLSSLKLKAYFDNEKPADIFTTISMLFSLDIEQKDNKYIIR